MASIAIAEGEDDNLVKNEVSSSPATSSGVSDANQAKKSARPASRGNSNNGTTGSSSRQSQLFIAFILSFLLIIIASISVFFREGSMIEMKHETIGTYGKNDQRLPIGTIPEHELIDTIVKGDKGDGLDIDGDEECHSRRPERIGRSGGPAMQYIHIPKTGGTTIQEELMKWGSHAGLNVYLHDGDHEKEWSCPASRVKHGILVGHRGFGYCRAFTESNKSPLYAVAFREPVSKFISEFDYFMQFEAREFDRYRRVWANKELEDLVIEYNNTLSMGLSEDDPKLKWPRAFVGLSKQQTSFMCGYNCIGIQGRKVPDEEKLRLALENLKKCDVVTIMEELDAFIPQLRMHVNWVPEKLHHFPKENHHRGKHSVLSDRAKAIVREWASIDMKLYEEAVKIHKKKTELAKKCLVIEEGKGKNDNDDNKAR